MLIKLLSKDDKNSLVSIAEFLSISDKPLLWNGKSMDEASAHIHDDDVIFSFARGEAESALLADWRKIPVEDSQASWLFMPAGRSGCYGKDATEAEKDFIDILRKVPLKLDNAAAEVRASAVSTVLRKLHEENKVSSNYAVRIVIFELMLMAFADGKISPIEFHVLRDLQHHYGVDDENFYEILEQAETVSKVSHKTLALILE
jgi:hypothetical protein